MGERVAAPGVTVVDDGTLKDRRGSLTIDDEGTPAQRTVLIEDGILTGYMQDRMNARLMGVSATGNGRRESYAHAPMPRMTNTYMLGGNDDPAGMVADLSPYEARGAKADRTGPCDASGPSEGRISLVGLLFTTPKPKSPPNDPSRHIYRAPHN